jgi:hypothetical protein
MCDRKPLLRGFTIWRVVGLGQMQPVLFGIEKGKITLRAETVASGRCAWGVYPLPWQKGEAKRALSELLSAKRDGRDSSAKAAWLARIR